MFVSLQWYFTLFKIKILLDLIVNINSIISSGNKAQQFQRWDSVCGCGCGWGKGANGKTEFCYIHNAFHRACNILDCWTTVVSDHL